MPQDWTVLKKGRGPGGRWLTACRGPEAACRRVYREEYRGGGWSHLLLLAPDGRPVLTAYRPLPRPALT